jgi:hypothetical protein
MQRALLVGTAALLAEVGCGPSKPAESPSTEPPVTGEPSSSAPPPVAVAPAAPPPPSSSVPYDKDAVEVELKQAARQVLGNCGAATDEAGKATGPWGKGTVTVTLGHNGHSQAVTVSAPFDGHPVGKCIERAFSLLTFPPFAGGDVPVDWPVEVTPPGHAH